MHNVCLTINNSSLKGGTERMCCMLANALTDKGYNVFVVSLYRATSTKDFFRYSPSVKRYSVLSNSFYNRISKIIKFADVLNHRYHRFLKKNSIEVVIDVDTLITYRTISAFKGLNIKHISWDHFCYDQFLTRQALFPGYRDIIKGVSNLVVLTQTDKALYNENENIPLERIYQISNFNPISSDYFIPKVDKRVLAMGRLEKVKGFDILLDSWKIIEDEGLDWNLEIVGNGSEKDALIKKCKDLKLKNVIFEPATNTPKNKYESASIFVLSSRREGFGLVLIEAMACSCACVSFNCPNGPKEIVSDGQDGILVPLGNVEALASSLIKLMNDSNLRTSISQNAFASSKRFSADNIIKQWIELIEN